MKKTWIIVSVVTAIVAAGGTYYWFVASHKAQLSKASNTVTPAPQETEVSEWKDEAGFSFFYPKDLKSDIHEEDNENYAHIEFTQSDHPGSIIVWAKDTTAADAAAWVKKEKTLATGTVFDTTFADMDGKKVLLNAPKKKVITAVVTDAIVFYVEGEFDQSDFWTKTYDTITSTFAFTPLSGSAGTAAAAGDEVSVDEEEVLE